MDKQKLCKICGKTRDLSDFPVDKRQCDGTRNQCRTCTKVRARKWEEDHAEQISERKRLAYANNVGGFRDRRKAYQEAHREERSQYSREYWQKNKERLSEQAKQWQEENTESVKEYRKQYYRKNRDLFLETTATNYRLNQEAKLAYAKEYRAKNHDLITAQKIQYYEANRDEILTKDRQRRQDMGEALNAQRRVVQQQRRDTDPVFRLNRSISSAIRDALRGKKGGRSWEILVGYTVQDLRQHMEVQFKAGMTWDNYGRKGWHVDHIIPVSLWQYDSPEKDEFRQCWCLANLQPLWAEENMRKHAKVLPMAAG